MSAVSKLVEKHVSREEFNNSIADEAAQSCVDWSDLEHRKEALRYIVKQIWDTAIAEQPRAASGRGQELGRVESTGASPPKADAKGGADDGSCRKQSVVDSTPARAASAGALSAPDGYAYRYPDGIRYTDGREINGSKPLEVIPFYFATSLAAHDQKVREPLAAWMVENSFATGHGETVEDLLAELAWQVKELRDAAGD